MWVESSTSFLFVCIPYIHTLHDHQPHLQQSYIQATNSIRFPFPRYKPITSFPSIPIPSRGSEALFRNDHNDILSIPDFWFPKRV